MSLTELPEILVTQKANIALNVAIDFINDRTEESDTLAFLAITNLYDVLCHYNQRKMMEPIMDRLYSAYVDETEAEKFCAPIIDYICMVDHVLESSTMVFVSGTDTQ